MTLPRPASLILLILLLGALCGLPGPGASAHALDLNSQAAQASTSGQDDPVIRPVPVPNSAAPTSAHIVIDEVTGWLEEGDVLRVSGRIDNPGDSALENPGLDLRMSLTRLSSRSAVNAWTMSQASHRVLATALQPGEQAPAGSGDSTPASTGEEDADPAEDEEQLPVLPEMPDRVEAGGSYDFEFALPADSLNLGTQSPILSWGARGLAVGLSGTADAALITHSAPAFTTWNPGAEPDPTRLTMIMPVTLTEFSSTGLLAPEHLEQAAAAGALSALLAAASVDDSIALAVDPRLLASIQAALGEDVDSAPALPGGSASPSGGEEQTEEEQEEPTAPEAPALRAWFADFLELASDRAVFALPWADADLRALREAGLDELADRAQNTDLVTELLPHAATDIAWPVSGTVRADSLRESMGAEQNVLILSDLQQTAITSYTSDARSVIDPAATGSAPAGGQVIDSLVVDTGLSQAIWEAATAASPATAHSEFIAESAAVTAERPYDSRHLLLVFPRSGADESWERIAATGAQAPWLDARPLDELLDRQPVSRSQLITPTRDAGLSAAGMGELSGAHTSGHDFSAVFTEPHRAQQDLTGMILSCTSTAWADASNFTDCTAGAAQQIAQLMGSIQPEDSTPVLLVTGERTTIPVLVQNTSHLPATVTVRITPRTPQLRTEDSEIIELPAGQTSRVDVPVEGLANGDVDAQVELVASNGYVLTHPGTVLVRVRADWENIGTAVIGAGLLAVLVIGLIKTVSRGRPTIPQSQLDAALARAQQGRQS